MRTLLRTKSDALWRIEYPSYGRVRYAHIEGPLFPRTQWLVPAAFTMGVHQ